MSQLRGSHAANYSFFLNDTSQVAGSTFLILWMLIVWWVLLEQP